MNRDQIFHLIAFLYLLLFPFFVLAVPYQVQVGDLVRVSLPGEESLDRSYAVNRQGEIILPEVGALKVVGLDEATMEANIHQSLQQIFRDLLNLKVYVEKRQQLINVLGYVETPGEVTLPANGTIQMALHQAGGLRAGAQLNQLQLRRGNSNTPFNYKQYLDHGDPALLPQLQSLDTLFIPASPMIGNVEVDFDPSKLALSGDAGENRKGVKVFGEVNSPGSFSYKPEMDLVDLLMRAGGVTRYAGVEQIRIISEGNPALFNLKRYLDSGDMALLPTVIEGATIFVPKQEEEIKAGANIVYVMGEVADPGAYENKSGATFMDILANAGGPTRFAESRQIRIIKGDGTIHPFDLAGYTEGTVPSGLPEIKAGDAIFVPEKTNMNEKSWLKIAPSRAVRVIGEVARPDRVEWSDEMSLLDLLAHVGGPRARADTANIEIVTPDESGNNQTTLFNLDAFIEQGQNEQQLPKIRAGSTIRVHDLPQDPSDNKSQWVRQSSEKSIYIFGQVGAPGRYMFTDRLNFLDILSAADGPTKDADLHNIRISHRNGIHAQVSKLNLALYFETGDEHLLPEVKMGDTIYIPEKERIWLDQQQQKMVRVMGAVHTPGRYRFNDSMMLLDLLAEAGGPKENAYLENIVVVNHSCCKGQSRSFNLTDFNRDADISRIPVLRAGDTIYVPDRGESLLAQFRNALGDITDIVSLGSLLGWL